MSPKTTRLVLASTSPVKLAAVTAAVQRMPCPASVTIVTQAVASGVPPQPLGMRETQLGASNRLAGIVDDAAECRILVSMESGIVGLDDAEEEGVPREITCIYLRVEDLGAPVHRGICIVDGPVLTDARYVPLLEQVKAAKGAVTLGSLLHAQDPSVPADAWYPRAELLTEALVSMLQELKA